MQETDQSVNCRRKAGRFFGNRGVAMLMVIWVLMLLTVIVTEFCYTMRTRLNITRNLKESTQAYYIAVAGVSEALSAILRQRPAGGREGLGNNGIGEEETQWRMNTDMPPISFAQGDYRVRIQNESGRININRAGEKLLQAILRGLELEEEKRAVIIDSIMDWRDANDLHRPNGAEDDYYQGLEFPYDCRDGDFRSVDELLLVRGVTPEIFHGGLEEMVTVLPMEGEGAGPVSQGLEDYSFDRVNLNAAPDRLLASLPGMTPELVEEIQAYRKEKDLTSIAQLRQIIGAEAYQRAAPYLTMDELAYYTIFSEGRVHGSRARQGVEARVVIDAGAEKKYRILQWLDRSRPEGMAHF
jgi:general secretion pathway protein K